MPTKTLSKTTNAAKKTPSPSIKKSLTLDFTKSPYMRSVRHATTLLQTMADSHGGVDAGTYERFKHILVDEMGAFEPKIAPVDNLPADLDAPSRLLRLAEVARMEGCISYGIHATLKRVLKQELGATDSWFDHTKDPDLPPPPKYLVAQYADSICFKVPADMDHDYNYNIKWGVLNYRSTNGESKQAGPGFGCAEGSDCKWPSRVRLVQDKPWHGDTDEESDEESGVQFRWR